MRIFQPDGVLRIWDALQLTESGVRPGLRFYLSRWPGARNQSLRAGQTTHRDSRALSDSGNQFVSNRGYQFMRHDPGVSPMAKEPRARRPKKAAPGAAGESLTVVLPAADPLAHIKHDLGGHVPGIQPSNTALPKVKSRKLAAKAKATAAAAKNGIDHPPWPLWEQAAPAKPKKFAWLSRLRARPLSQMSAAIVIAASCGAITGSLATVGVARFLPLDVLTSSVDTDLAQQVARIDAELVTLKAGLSTTASVDARRADTSERPDPRSAVSNDATGSIQAAALVPSPV